MFFCPLKVGIFSSINRLARSILVKETRTRTRTRTRTHTGPLSLNSLLPSNVPSPYCCFSLFLVLLALALRIPVPLQVQSERGNSLKLTCYEEQAGGKALIGEGSTKVVETGMEGTWVPITDDRRVRERERETPTDRQTLCLHALGGAHSAAACCDPTSPNPTSVYLLTNGFDRPWWARS